MCLCVSAYPRVRDRQTSRSATDRRERERERVRGRVAHREKERVRYKKQFRMIESALYLVLTINHSVFE